MKSIEKTVYERLFALRDEKFREFHRKLIPNVPESTIIGVRTPDIRALAKEMKKDGSAAEYIKILPHKYYEEYNLHGAIISDMRDYDMCVSELGRFLPYVDNWATCDLMRPVSFKKHKNELIAAIDGYLKSDHVYTVRFGMEMLMTYYLDEDFKPEYLQKVSAIHSDEYYLNMMQAWYFATALAKQYEYAIPYLENNVLGRDAHNMTVSKCRDSFRISAERKAYIKSLKR